jgi:hypothetical protein
MESASPVQPRFAGVLLAGLIGLGLLAIDLLLAAAVLLLAWHSTAAQITVALFAAAGGFVAFYAAGSAASSLGRARSMRDAVWSGLSSWALIVVTLGLLAGARVSTSLTQMTFGVGGGLGSASMMSAAFEEVSRIDVRLSGDLDITKGSFQARASPIRRESKIAERSSEELEKNASWLFQNEEARGAFNRGRKIAGALSLSLFLGLSFGAGASLLGARRSLTSRPSSESA